MGYETDWSVVTDNLPIFMEGLLVTLKVSALALLISLPLGVIAGLCRISRNRILSALATVYVEFIRGIPLLVLLLWIFFVLGKLMKLSSFWAAVLGLAIFSGAFVAEIIRAGIQSVPRGQMEAARSSGMSYYQAMRLIILPQALRKVLPPLASQFIILIKDSSLASVVSVVDLSLVGHNLVATTFRVIEVWTFIALVYFVITFTLSQIIRYFERKYKVFD